MWFNNAVIYQYELKDTALDLASLLSDEALKPCPPHARFVYGWLPHSSKEFIQTVSGCSLICLGKEERILPKGVIKRLLSERIQLIEEQQGRQVKRAERAQMAEDIEFELLPKSFCIQKRLLALFDTVSNRLIINSSSNNQASQLTALLRKTIPGIHFEPLPSSENLALRFAQWINNPALLPRGFALASDCLLFSLDNEKKRINCKGYELPAEEILALLAQGLVAAEISLVWNERIQFTLTHDLILKRLKSLDYLVDEMNEVHELEDKDQQQDAALTLISGELRALVDALLAGVGNNQVMSEQFNPEALQS